MRKAALKNCETGPDLTEEEVTTVAECVARLARTSGLTPFECLALLEEAATPLSFSDRARVLRRLGPNYEPGVVIH